jgi:hypothetical protein
MFSSKHYLLLDQSIFLSLVWRDFEFGDAPYLKLLFFLSLIANNKNYQVSAQILCRELKKKTLKRNYLDCLWTLFNFIGQVMTEQGTSCEYSKSVI